MKTCKSMLFFAITALLVAACGGGGGGDEAGITVPTAPAAGVSITAGNAGLISAEVLSSVAIIEGFSGGLDFLPAVQVNAAVSDFSYPDFFVQQLQRLPALATGSSQLSVTGIIIPPDTQPCDANHGTITISGEVADPNSLTVGDKIVIRFNDCELGGIVLNGKMAMTVTLLSPGFDFTPPYSLGVDVVLTLFSVDDGIQVAYSNGDISMQLSENVINDETLVLSGSSLTAWSGGMVETLTGYRYDLLRELDGDYSIDLKGKLASTVIGGSVSFESTQTFIGNELLGDGNPTAGVLWVSTSADASQARLTAQPDGVAVWIEVDTDGDNTYDPPIMTTWAELEAL